MYVYHCVCVYAYELNRKEHFLLIAVMILLIYQLKSLLKICIFKMQASLRLLIPKLRNKYEAYDN